MINYSKTDVENMDKITRLTLINSITGYKPGNLIATVDNAGNTNVAIFSSVVHLGSDPALIGFIMRPLVGERHTMENILATGFYTINHVNQDIAEKAHYTSANFPKEISEFDSCKLTPIFIDEFKAPFVKESRIKIGLSYVESVDIKINGTTMVIGQVEFIYLDDLYFSLEGGLDLETAGTICISGLDSYHEVKKIAQYPYARVKDVPKF